VEGNDEANVRGESHARVGVIHGVAPAAAFVGVEGAAMSCTSTIISSSTASSTSGSATSNAAPTAGLREMPCAQWMRMRTCCFVVPSFSPSAPIPILVLLPSSRTSTPAPLSTPRTQLTTGPRAPTSSAKGASASGTCSRWEGGIVDGMCTRPPTTLTTCVTPAFSSKLASSANARSEIERCGVMGE